MCFFVERRPPGSTRSDTLFRYTTLVRARDGVRVDDLRLVAVRRRAVDPPSPLPALGGARSRCRLRPAPPHARRAADARADHRVRRSRGKPRLVDFLTVVRSAEHMSELQTLMRISYAVF